MKEFENAKTEAQGVHYSRYIASWRNVGGDYFGNQFEKWLKENSCTKNEIADIVVMATCGKMELEKTAKAYVNKMNELIQKVDNGEEPEEEP